MTINLFSSKLNYILLNADDTDWSLKKIGASKTAHILCGYSIDEFNKFHNIDFLIPPCVRLLHD